MNIQVRKPYLLIQYFKILQLRHTTFITQSLKENHSGRKTGLIDPGPVQLALNLLHNWCQQNGMVLNIDKTKVMFITSRANKAQLANHVLSLRYSDKDIKITPSERILGVYVDDNLMWNNHFQHVSKQISYYLWLLSKIRSYLSRDM